MPDRVRITDVSPRDGLQNEPGVIPARAKVELVRALLASGLDEIEVSSFVSLRWVPQLGDAAEVFAAIAADHAAATDRPMLSALVPNEKGLDGALAVNAAYPGLIGKVSVFTAASESFASRNINATIEESIERFVPVVRRAHAAGLLVRGYVSCAIACPFEGAIVPDKVIEVSRKLLDIGVDEIDLGDTIGAGTPGSVRALLDAYAASFGPGAIAPERFTLHLHDTFGTAAACVRAALAAGVRSFDGSAGGLGGCPYASTPNARAPGNVATGVVVREVRAAGLECGVRADRLAAADACALALTARPGPGADA